MYSTRAISKATISGYVRVQVVNKVWSTFSEMDWTSLPVRFNLGRSAFDVKGRGSTATFSNALQAHSLKPSVLQALAKPQTQ